MLEGMVYGFGKSPESNYVIKGSFTPFNQTVVLHEFVNVAGLPQRFFQGQLTMLGPQRAIVGMWSTPEGKRGNFRLVLNEQMPQPAPPILTISIAQPPTAAEEHAPSKKESAKLPSPPVFEGAAPNPVFQPQLVQYQSPAFAGFNGATQQFCAPQPMFSPQLFQAVANQVVTIDPHLISRAKSAFEVNQVNSLVMQGQKVDVEDLMSLYKLSFDCGLKVQMTNVVAPGLINLTPQALFECVRLNPQPEVQLSILQAIGPSLRGRLPPEAKKDILEVICFADAKNIARGILAHL
jgi:hypothetical protein